MDKQKIHDLIVKSDLPELKKYVDAFQISLVSFDEPSLLMMAISVYLDPGCILNREYQLEMIEFLSKCGLRFYIPGGSFILGLHEYYYGTESKEEKIMENIEFQTKVISLVDCLIGLDGGGNIILAENPKELGGLGVIGDYICRSQAAIRIQRWWRKSGQ
tara:strand:+ start:1630 stop:2109 length:480 start_codon:yes stop_codon:yes gene_type:complete